MKSHCNIGESLQTQIDFCLLFRASKKLKQQAEICLYEHAWVILTELLIPSCQMIQIKVQEQMTLYL